MTRGDLENINRALELRWGGRPRYRVVFADEQLEVRDRIEKGERVVNETRKYQNCAACYVLEKDVREFGCPPDIKNWNGYEMIWPFKFPGTDDPLNPSIKVCMFITEALENGVKRTAKDYYDMEKKRFDDEVQRNFEILDDEAPYISSMVQNKEGIFVPRNFKKDE
jgi:hypothetical protein